MIIEVNMINEKFQRSVDNPCTEKVIEENEK